MFLNDDSFDKNDGMNGTMFSDLDHSAGAVEKGAGLFSLVFCGMARKIVWGRISDSVCQLDTVLKVTVQVIRGGYRSVWEIPGKIMRRQTDRNPGQSPEENNELTRLSSEVYGNTLVRIHLW